MDKLTCEVSWEKIKTLTLSDNQKIISLSEFLVRFADLFDGIILDVKGDNNFYEEKANSLCEVIAEYSKLNRLYIIGYPCLVLSAAKHIIPELRVGCEDRGVIYNYLSGKDLISLHYRSQYSYLEYLMARKLNLKTILWTVNKRHDLVKLAQLNNTIILTDLHSIH